MLDLAGRAVLPGLVGMHNHLYYIEYARSARAGSAEKATPLLPELFYSAPRLYLAGGVTTMRTTGCVEPYADLSLRKLIDSGQVPGPSLDVTAPYLEGPGGFFPQMPVVKDAAEARRFVAFWADAGATSIKAYMHISRGALKAAIEEAHRRKIKVTGHLCSVTYAEAAALGIDDLEHGFFVSTDFASGKKPDECPEAGADATLTLDPDGPELKKLIRTLVSHHVAVTSTLPMFEQGIPKRKQDRRGIALLAPEFRASYEASRRTIDDGSWGLDWEKAYRNDLRLERAFVAAGGLLLAGPDPTGNGGVIPGFADQREVELLVEAGFHARRGDPHRDVQWRRVPRPARRHRHRRKGKAGRPRRRARRSERANRSHRSGRVGVQERRRLRPGRAHRCRARKRRSPLKSGRLGNPRSVSREGLALLPARRPRDQRVRGLHREPGRPRTLERRGDRGAHHTGRHLGDVGRGADDLRGKELVGSEPDAQVVERLPVGRCESRGQRRILRVHGRRERDERPGREKRPSLGPAAHRPVRDPEELGELRLKQTERELRTNDQLPCVVA